MTTKIDKLLREIDARADAAKEQRSSCDCELCLCSADVPKLVKAIRSTMPVLEFYALADCIDDITAILKE